MQRTQIYLPFNQQQLLKKQAIARNISISQVIRELINNQLQAKKPSTKVKPGLLELGKNLQMFHQKGPKDLATNLDAYLYGNK